MNIRKERTHRCGHSNIDFRSKKDTDSLQTYQPWKCKKEFGTMGYTDFKLSFNDHKKALENTQQINCQRNILSEVPDPKYHKTAQYYSQNKIPIKSKTIYTNERVAQLDESFKGKDMYTGDSMMIADITKFRKNKTKKFYDREKHAKSKH
jgi:hypothetical protein